MYEVILFLASGVLGTILALRLMAIEAEVKPSKLTVRGRIVVGITTGLCIAIIVYILCGMWWDCDLRAGATTPCSIGWGY